MYWGDTDIFLAWSEDLVDWTPVERAASAGQPAALASAITPRRNRFDSALVEPGPQAIVTPSGILLLYNSANRRPPGDSSLPEMAYSAGQALFDAKDPGALIGRTTEPFLSVRTQHETVGQVGNVCFVEGLVRFNGTMAALLRDGRFDESAWWRLRNEQRWTLKLSLPSRVCLTVGVFPNSTEGKGFNVLEPLALAWLGVCFLVASTGAFSCCSG